MKPLVPGFAVLLLLSILTGIPVSAQAPALVLKSFVENVRTSVPSAGMVFRGFQHGESDAPPDLSKFAIVLPPTNQTLLCLTIESQDGGYFAEASYTVDNRSAARYQSISLPTGHKALLQSRPLKNMSVIAFLSNSCRPTDALFLPVTFRGAKDLQKPLTLVINSRTPGVTVRVFHQETRRYFSCARDTGSDRQVAFNTRCTVELPPGTRETTLTIVRNRAEEQLAPETVRAYFP